MTKLNINYSKKRKIFKINLNNSEVLFNLKTINLKSKILSIPNYHFMLVLRILARCGFVKPFKKF